MRALLTPLWCALGLAAGCSSNPGVVDAAGASSSGGSPGQGGSTSSAGQAGASSSAGLFIVGVLARHAGACTAVPDPNAPLQAVGAVDRLLASEYPAAVLFGSNAAEQISLTGLEVKLETLAGETVAEPYTLAVTGFVTPNEGGLTVASLLPGGVLASLEPGPVVSYLTAFGRTPAGATVQSSSLLFSVQVCDGCLISYPASAQDTTAPGPDYQCKGAEADPPSADALLPCTLGVDLPAPCTMCSDEIDACKSPANNPYAAP